MGAVDVYRITDQLDDATLDVLIARLEARGKHPRFEMMMREYLDAMAIDSARYILDLGCGTGVVARTIARRPPFAGRVMGVDRSPHLVAAASRLAREEGISERVAFRTGDSHVLALRDMEFDAVVAHTLFRHLEDPRSLLTEIVRVLEPGGKVGIFDGDYASMTFASDDPAAGKATDEMIINAIVTNPCVTRQMPQLLQEAGLRLTAAFSYIVADIGRADFWDTSVKSLIRLLPNAGAMTESQAEAWAAAMLARSEQGTFFGASNYYGFVAMKPESVQRLERRPSFSPLPELQRPLLDASAIGRFWPTVRVGHSRLSGNSGRTAALGTANHNRYRLSPTLSRSSDTGN